ncbi:TetR family transcriptional regulator [Nocardioides sp. GY 10113]|uniref:TetR/AcrR family transcriptional regulator n=1 Tax=Nocardioides sp. GY 10113 TaxID=2569761 RepID=UPI0010A8EE10|nr:TetR family transcriptional regulator [Nocardioides sp. GY 10113]TIC85110.1 TetR family transcriptional regulator [Nocardioides sp. GY 10113]
MTTPGTERPRTERTRAALIDRAERMIAERGTGVSLREISAAAGQRNHSAAQYHFGSREGLIDAVVATRSARIDRRRAELLAGLDGAADADSASIESLLAALVAPWVELLDTDEASYSLRFLAQVLDDPELERALAGSGDRPTALSAINRRLARHLQHLGPEDRARRLTWTHSVALRVLAHEERLGSRPGPGLAAVRDDLIAMLAALLRAPGTGSGRVPETPA